MQATLGEFRPSRWPAVQPEAVPSDNPGVFSCDSADPTVPAQRSATDGLEIPADAALRRLEALLADHDSSCGVLVFGFEDAVGDEPVAVASGRLRGALATMGRVWSPLRATFSRLQADRFLVVVDGLPDTVPAATFALALRYEVCSALRSHDERVADVFCVGSAIPGDQPVSAVDLVHQAHARTALPAGADMLISA